MATKATKIDLLLGKLYKRIKEGFYPPGKRLPSERKICDELKVSRDTVRGAIRRLQEENLVDIVPKGGAYVKSENLKMTIGDIKASTQILKSQELKNAGSFVLSMKNRGIGAVVKFIEPSSIIPAGKNIGEKLDTNVDTKVLRRYRIHYANKKPYRILDSYYLADLLGGLLGKDEGYIPLFKWLYKEKSVYANKAFEKINIRMPNADEAKLLKISRSQSVVDMDRWVWANDKTLFEYTRIIANASLHEYTYLYDISKEVSK
jgi:GntR family transcriptional regulator